MKKLIAPFIYAAAIGALIGGVWSLTSRRPIDAASKAVVKIYTSEIVDDVLRPEGSGSGVAVDAHCVLTCWHVVQGADRIIVSWEGQRALASVLGHDSNLDLALLKVQSLLPPAARWGDSDAIAVADDVYAIGYPFDLTRLVRRGVVAALDYSIEDTPFLVTDAAINPGDSGGGIFDSRGRLLGLSARIQMIQGLRANIGIAYIVPSSLARQFVIETLSKKAP